MSDTIDRHNGVRNLLELSVEERQSFIDSFDYVVTDCDGKYAPVKVRARRRFAVNQCW